jgi:hypothetical protein
LQDQHGSYFPHPLVESDNLPRKLVGDLNGYEEPVGTDFGKWKHWDLVMKEMDAVCGATTEAIAAAVRAGMDNDLESTASSSGFADAVSEIAEEEKDKESNPAAVDGGVPGFMYGGEKWSRGLKIHSAPPTSYLYFGLPPKGNLNSFQRETVYTCMRDVEARFNGKNNKMGQTFCKSVAAEWNRKHMEADVENIGSGIGGLTTWNHIYFFLKAEGQNRADEIIGVKPSPIGYGLSIPMPGCVMSSAPPIVYSLPHPVAVASLKRTLPCKYKHLKMVESWNARELEAILKHFGLKQRGTNEEKRGRLRDKLSSLKKAPSKKRKKK